MVVVDNVELDLVMVKVEGIWFLRALEINWLMVVVVMVVLVEIRMVVVVMLVQDSLLMTLQEGSEQGTFGDQLA